MCIYIYICQVARAVAPQARDPPAAPRAEAAPAPGSAVPADSSTKSSRNTGKKALQWISKLYSHSIF